MRSILRPLLFGYPIPALLVISGRLGLGQANLSGLRESLQKDFWYGQMVPKGVEEPDAIERALLKTREYCDVGVHIRDAPGRLCPTLSPREEDLLRRCVLGIPQCIGVDLEWWGKYLGISSSIGAVASVEKKVLAGKFLFKNGLESSRPSFFKFEETAMATHTYQATALMAQKFGHIKLIPPTPIQSSSRSLLVTQQVGGLSQRLISLSDLLAQESKVVLEAIPQVVSNVIGQLASLGTVVENQFQVSELLWKWYDIAKVEAAYLAHGGDKDVKPIRLLQHLRDSNKLTWAKRQPCIHGDLNATNIAIEIVDSSYRAYIFDAEGVRPDSAVRDLAMLEISSLLFQPLSGSQDLIEECKVLYATGASVPDLSAVPTIDPVVRNTLCLVREIRRHVVETNQLQPYALMVFDCVMLQLGGLAVQSQANKIANPKAGVRLADLAAAWLIKVAPELTA